MAVRKGERLFMLVMLKAKVVETDSDRRQCSVAEEDMNSAEKSYNFSLNEFTMISKAPDYLLR